MTFNHIGTLMDVFSCVSTNKYVYFEKTLMDIYGIFSEKYAIEMKDFTFKSYVLNSNIVVVRKWNCIFKGNDRHVVCYRGEFLGSWQSL